MKWYKSYLQIFADIADLYTSMNRYDDILMRKRVAKNQRMQIEEERWGTVL